MSFVPLLPASVTLPRSQPVPKRAEQPAAFHPTGVNPGLGGIRPHHSQTPRPRARIMGPGRNAVAQRIGSRAPCRAISQAIAPCCNGLLGNSFNYPFLSYSRPGKPFPNWAVTIACASEPELRRLLGRKK